MELSGKVGDLSTTYLGLPLGAHCNSMTMWDDMEEHFKKRLMLWKDNISLRVEEKAN